MSSLLLGPSYELLDPTALTSLGFESLSLTSLAFSSPMFSLGIDSGLSNPDTNLLRNDQVICRVSLNDLVYST